MLDMPLLTSFILNSLMNFIKSTVVEVGIDLTVRRYASLHMLGYKEQPI